MRFASPLSFLALLGSLAALGCTGGGSKEGPSTSAPSHVVYVLNNGGSSISTYWADAEGRLSPHDPASGAVWTPDNPLNFCLDSRQGRMYTIGGFASRQRVGLFTLSTAGELSSTALPGWPLPVPDDETDLAFDPEFRFAFAPDGNRGTLTAYQVQADGSLRLNPASNNPVPCGGHPGSLVIDPTGRFLYVLADGQVWTYRLQADGSLASAGAPASVGGNGTMIALAPNGQALYAVDLPRGQIHLLRVQADGTPAPASPADDTPMTGLYPWRMALDPSGRFAFVAASNRIWGFKVNANGTLRPNDPVGGPIATGRTPGLMAFAPEGKVMYVPNQDDDTLSAFAVDAEGQLAPLQAIRTGGAPNRVLVR